MKQCFFLVLMALLAAACGGNGSPTDPSQVTIEFSTVDLAAGSGPQATAGNAVNVRYTLWLYDPAGPDRKGVQRESGTFGFILGRQQAITGFDQGVRGMQVGARRRIYVPASLGYGSQGSPPSIPPNAALVFEVELLELIP